MPIWNETLTYGFACFIRQRYLHGEGVFRSAAARVLIFCWPAVWLASRASWLTACLPLAWGRLRTGRSSSWRLVSWSFLWTCCQQGTCWPAAQGPWAEGWPNGIAFEDAAEAMTSLVPSASIWCDGHAIGHQASSDYRRAVMAFFFLANGAAATLGWWGPLWCSSKSRNVAGLTRAHFWMTDCCYFYCRPCERCPMLLGMIMTTMVAQARQQVWMPDSERGDLCISLRWKVLKATLPNAALFTCIGDTSGPEPESHATHNWGEGIYDQWCHGAGQQAREASIHQ